MKVGIVGNGKIVHAALIALGKLDCTVSALYCRSKAKGEALNKQYGLDMRIYDDYDAFLKEDIDVVYVALVNSLHFHYAQVALKARKHVIVEKPFTVNFDQALQLVRLAKAMDCMLFEAILLRYSSNLETLRWASDQCAKRTIVQSVYGQYSSRYDAYCKKEVLSAFDPKYAGGALMDINIYNLHLMVTLFGRAYELHYLANRGFNGIDTSGVLSLSYPSFHALCIGAKDTDMNNGLWMDGPDHHLEMHSRPGIIQNLILDGKDIPLQTEDPMVQEFKTIFETIQNRDYNKVRNWMEETLLVMYMLDMAKEDSGMDFENCVLQ